MKALMIFAVICAYIVKGLCGFANTLVFTSILSFRANNVNISPVELFVGFPANIIMAWKNRKQISLRVCLPLAALIIIGALPGTFLLKHGDAEYIKIFFGIVILLIAVEMLLREVQKQSMKPNPIVMVVLGILSGVLSGMFGVGALLAAYVSRTSDNSSEMKGNLSIVFLIENVFRIVLYAMTGILTAEVFHQALILLPFMAIGLFLGMFLSNKMKESIVKKAVILLLILSGISLVLANIG